MKIFNYKKTEGNKESYVTLKGNSFFVNLFAWLITIAMMLGLIWIIIFFIKKIIMLF